MCPKSEINKARRIIRGGCKADQVGARVRGKQTAMMQVGPSSHKGERKVWQARGRRGVDLRGAWRESGQQQAAGIGLARGIDRPAVPQRQGWRGCDGNAAPTRHAPAPHKTLSSRSLPLSVLIEQRQSICESALRVLLGPNENEAALLVICPSQRRVSSSGPAPNSPSASMASACARPPRRRPPRPPLGAARSRPARAPASWSV